MSIQFSADPSLELTQDSRPISDLRYMQPPITSWQIISPRAAAFLALAMRASRSA
jgi:hypothetical protein